MMLEARVEALILVKFRAHPSATLCPGEQLLPESRSLVPNSTRKISVRITRRAGRESRLSSPGDDARRRSCQAATCVGSRLSRSRPVHNDRNPNNYTIRVALADLSAVLAFTELRAGETREIHFDRLRNHMRSSLARDERAPTRSIHSRPHFQSNASFE